MDKFLDAFKQPKLNQEALSHLNCSITSNEIEAIMKSLPTKKSSEPNGFMVEFYQTFKEELISLLLKLCQEIEREGTLPNSSMKPALHSFQNPIKMQQKRIIDQYLYEYSCKDSQNILANRIQEHIKKIVHHD
jgi:hypothetical protein